MRMLLIAAAVLAAPVATAQITPSAPVIAPLTGSSTPATRGTIGTPTAHQIAYQQLVGRLKTLRKQGLALQEEDGGTLTPEHRALIQRRLDAIQAAYAPYRRD